MDTKRLSGNERRMTVLRSGVLAGMWAAALAAGAGNVYTNSASGNWNAAASWNGAMPAAGGAADAAVVFNGAGVVASTNNLSGTFLLNRIAFVSGTTVLSGNTLTFTNNGALGPQVVNTSGSLATIGNSVVLGNDTTFDTGNSMTLAALLSGKGGITKTGANTLTLPTNNHTYVGSTVVASGTLVIQTIGTPANSSISSTNFVIQSGATLRIAANANPFWNAPAASVFNIQSNATLQIQANALNGGYMDAPSGATVTGSPQLVGVDKAGRITANLGSLNFARILLTPPSSVNATQTVRFDGTGSGLVIGTSSGTPFSWRHTAVSGASTINMDIADSPAAPVDLLVPWLNLRPGANGTAFYKQGSGVMQLNVLDWSSASSPVKPVSCTVNSGAFILNTDAANALGVNFSSVTIDSGAVFQVGTNGNEGTLYVDITDNGTLAFNRSNAYLFTPAVSGTGRLVQRGRGTLTLNGTHTYSGGTEVESGTLLVAAPGALNGAGTVAVTGGTLGGDGIVGGPVAVTGGGVLLPGGSNTVGTLTLANAGAAALTLSGGRLL